MGDRELIDGAVVLEPCPFCSEPLFVRAGVNAYARCRTEGCWANRCQVIALDDDRQVAEWNTRSLPQGDRGGDWVMVPRTLTPEMGHALESNIAECLPPSPVHAANWQDAYAAMLSAAPAAPEGNPTTSTEKD